MSDSSSIGLDLLVNKKKVGGPSSPSATGMSSGLPPSPPPSSIPLLSESSDLNPISLDLDSGSKEINLDLGSSGSGGGSSSEVIDLDALRGTNDSSSNPVNLDLGSSNLNTSTNVGNSSGLGDTSS